MGEGLKRARKAARASRSSRRLAMAKTLARAEAKEVERVSKLIRDAIVKSMYNQEPTPWPDVDPRIQMRYRAAARAVIEDRQARED